MLLASAIATGKADVLTRLPCACHVAVVSRALAWIYSHPRRRRGDQESVLLASGLIVWYARACVSNNCLSSRMRGLHATVRPPAEDSRSWPGSRRRPG